MKRGANASGAFGDGSLIRDPQKRVRQPFSRLPVTKPDGGEGTRDVNYKALIGNPSLLLLAYAPVHASRVRQRRRKTEYREHSRILVVTCPALPRIQRAVIVSSLCSLLAFARSACDRRDPARVFPRASSTRFDPSCLVPGL